MTKIDPRFQRIERTWLVAANRTKLDSDIARHGNNWDSKAFDWLKKILKAKLRKRQMDKCCYCRRTLRYDKGLVEIEHIVDKGSQSGRYKRFTYEIRNLALSCKDCNNNKSTKSVLTSDLSSTDPYPNNPGAFTWVHPHLHNYSDHITIYKGWVYVATTGSAEGSAVIIKCSLHKLEEKERKNRILSVDGAANLNSAIAIASTMTDEVQIDRLCKEFGRRIAKRWNSTPTIVEREMRNMAEAVKNMNTAG